jgi:hypothetical protein
VWLVCPPHPHHSISNHFSACRYLFNSQTCDKRSLKVAWPFSQGGHLLLELGNVSLSSQTSSRQDYCLPGLSLVWGQIQELPGKQVQDQRTRQTSLTLGQGCPSPPHRDVQMLPASRKQVGTGADENYKKRRQGNQNLLILWNEMGTTQ